MPPRKIYDLNEPLDCLRFLADKIMVPQNTVQCAGLLDLLPPRVIFPGASRETKIAFLANYMNTVIHGARNARNNPVAPIATRTAASHVMAAGALLGIVEAPRQHDDGNRNTKLKTTKDIRQGYAGQWVYPEKTSGRRVRDHECEYLTALLDALRETLNGRPLFEHFGSDVLAKVAQRQGLQSPDDLRLDRSLFHVVRTLETRREHASPDYARRIDEALALYREWNQQGSYNAGFILQRFDSLCRDLLDRPVYDLIGRIKIGGECPRYGPHEMLPFCQYPNGESLSFVPGGTDSFTGETVEPFFMAVYPVTAYEWHHFLQKFDWPEGRNTWNRLFPEVDWLALPDVPRWPAVGMTFYDCVAYCFWLWHRTPYHFRLPTEAEWNFAATGGKRLCFPWGNRPNFKLGRYTAFDVPQAPGPVDELSPAGPHSIAGLSGNVWEYTSTLWQGEDAVPNSSVVVPDLALALASYRWWKSDTRAPKNMDERSWRNDIKLVIKGGSYALGPKYGEIGQRSYSSFFNAGAYGGLRIVVSAIRNENADQYVPKSSPFVNADVSQVQLISSLDFAGNRVPGLTFGGCEVGTTLHTLGPPKGDSSWDELLRRRYHATQ